MNFQNIRLWVLVFSIAVLLIPIKGTHEWSTRYSKAKRNNVYNKPTSSRRDIISGFNRENLVDSHEEYLLDNGGSFGNQIASQEDPSLRSEAAGQQSMFLPAAEIDDSVSPLGEAQSPTIAAPDYKIAYSDGLPYPTHSSRSQNNLLVYDTPQDPLDESDSNTVKIADPSANKKLFNNDGFSHGMGELNNAINSLLINKVLSSDNDKDFNKELKLLSEEFAKDDDQERNERGKSLTERKKQSPGKKQECQPSAKSIFANCKKKRSAVCSPEDRDTFYKNALNIHNLFRKIHGVPDLEMNERLSKDAQDYAEHLAKTASSLHSLRKDRPGQGENIAVGCTSAGSELRAKEAISQWYSKACQNEFDFNGYKKGVEPFAQVIWKSTSFLGMGKAVSNRDGNLCTYIVARYSPEGDKNSFAQNVLKGTFSKGGICGSSCVVKGNIIHAEVAKAVQAEKFNSENLDESESTVSTKPEENLKDEKANEEELKNRKRPVQPEIKKVEDTKPEDSVDHKVLGSTKIRGDKDDEKTAGQVQKPHTIAKEKSHSNTQEIATETSGTGHGLSKMPNSDTKMITDQDFAAANSHQNDQANESKPHNGSWNQEKNRGRDTDGSIKDGIQITSNKPTSKVPMLINITFPQQLQTRNNSMIQITVGDDGLNKASPSEQAGFKPVVNFAGRSDDHLATNDDEFFDKEDRNEKLNEGKLNDHGLSFIGDSTHQSQSEVGYKMDDFAFDTSIQHLKHPNLETAEKLQNASVVEPLNVVAGEAKSEPQHMFQDRKGMNSKNGDNSVTYLKIATKLMNDKDTTDNIDYFIPKQLENEATTTIPKEKNDYGFTDQNSEEEEEVDDLDSRYNESVSSSDKMLKKGGKKKNVRNKERVEDNKDLQDNGKSQNNGNKSNKGKQWINANKSNNGNKWNKGEKEKKGSKEYNEANDDGEEILDNEHNYNKDNDHSYPSNSQNSLGSSVKSSSGKDDKNSFNENESVASEQEEKEGAESSGYVSRNKGSSGRSKSDAVDNSAAKDESGNGRKAGKNINRFGSSFESEKETRHKATSSSMIADDSENDSSESGFTSNGVELSMGIAKNDKSHRKMSNFNAKPKHSVRYSSPKGHWRKENSDNRFKANVEEMKTKGKQKALAHKHVSEVHVNGGSSKTISGAPEGYGKMNQHLFGLAANMEKPHVNGGRYTKVHGKNIASVAKGTTSFPESSISHKYSDKQSEEAKDISDMSYGTENRKFLKLMDSEVSDHRIERQKQVHGKLESNKYTNLEQQILSQHVNKVHKKPEKIEFEEKIGNLFNLFDKDDDLSTKISKLHSKVEDANKQITEKEQNGEFSFHFRKPESVSQEYKKPESVSQEYMKPETMSQEYKKPETTSQVYKKPESVSQEYMKPESVSQEYNKPETVSQEYKKPEPMSQEYVKPESMSQEYKKPESVSQDYKFGTENRTIKVADQSHEPNEGWEGKLNGTQYVNNLDKKYVYLENNGENITSSAYDMQSQSNDSIGFNGEFTTENKTASFNQTEAKKETGTLHALLNEKGISNSTVENVMENKTGNLENGSSNFKSESSNFNSGSSNLESGSSNLESGNKGKDLWNGDDLSQEMKQSNSSVSNNNYTNLLNNFDSNLRYSFQNQSISPVTVKQNENTTDQDEASNTTTINVGTGFIKIKYEKPTVQNRISGNSSLTDHLIHGESPSTFVGYSQGQGISTRDSGGIRKELEINRNTELKVGNFSDEKGNNNAGYNQTTLFHGDEVLNSSSKEQSFSPVINRKNSHHFVIQIRPTHALDGYKVSGGSVAKFQNGVSSFNNHDGGSEFEDVSKMKHVSRKKFRDDTTDDNDITEDLMTDNVRDSSKNEEGIKTYIKNDSKEDLFGMSENNNEGKAPTAQGKMAFNHDKQTYYEKSNQKPGRIYHQHEEYKTKNSRKFASSHFPAAETLPGMHNADHKFGQDGEAGNNENDISSSGYKQAASKGDKMPWLSNRNSLNEKLLESSQGYSMFDMNEKQSKGTRDWRNNQTTEGDTHKNKSKLKNENVVEQDVNKYKAHSSSSKQSLPQHDIYHINQNSGSRLFAKYDSSDIITSDSQNYNEEGITSEFETEKNKSPNVKKKGGLRKNSGSNAAKTSDTLGGRFAPAQKSEDKDSMQMQSAQVINDKKLFKSIENIIKDEESKNMYSKEDSDDIKEKTSDGHIVSSSYNFHKAFKNEKDHQLHGDRSKDKPNSLKSDSYNAKEKDITESKLVSSRPACKSNCESPPLRDVANGRDESNVVGLNLQTGYDRFSGFHRVHKNEDLIGRRIEIHANSPFFMGDKSSHSVETGNELIFIPEEAIRQFQRDMTKQHNKYRTIHDAPYVRLDSQLSRDSQQYAKELASKGSVSHSLSRDRPETGESIEKLCSYNEGMPSASQVLKKWYNEVCDPGYIFTRDGKQSGTGHFTQVVWKDTKSIGIGLAASKESDGRICSYVVARYFKAGNDLATIRSNVARGTFRSCNRPSQGVHPTTGHLSSYSMSHKKLSRPTLTHKSTAHHTPTYAYRHFASGPSRFSHRSNRNRGHFGQQVEGFNAIWTGKQSDAKVYKPSQGGATMMFTKDERVHSAKAVNFGDRTNTEGNKETFMDEVRGPTLQSYMKSYTGRGKQKDTNLNNDFGSELSHPGSTTQKASLLEKPRHNEFSFGHAASMNWLSDSFEREESGTKPKMTEKQHGYENSMFKSTKGKHDGLSPNRKGYPLDSKVDHNSLHPESYFNGDSNDEFYIGSQQGHRPFQTQIKSNDFDHKTHLESASSVHHFGNVVKENSKLLPPTTTSFHGKQRATPSKYFRHNKPTDTHKLINLKQANFASTAERPHASPKKENFHSNYWSKTEEKAMTEDKPKTEESSKLRINQNNENMVEKDNRNEDENTAHDLSLNFEKEHSKPTDSMSHDSNEKAYSHNEANNFHGDSQYGLNEEYNAQNKGPIHGSSPQPPVHSHQKANVKFDASDSIKTDHGFLTGINAALSMERNADAHDFYNEPAGIIDSAKAYAGIGSTQELQGTRSGGQSVSGGQFDNQIDLNSLREEGSNIEASLSDDGLRNSDQSFEEGLIKSVSQGRADVLVERRPEDYKIPSVLMDEYQYNTPENGGGENLYDSLSQELGEKMGKIASRAGNLNTMYRSRKERDWRKQGNQGQKQETSKGNTKLEKPISSVKNSMSAHRYEGKNLKDMQRKTGEGSIDDAPNQAKLNENGSNKKEISFSTSDKSTNHDVGFVKNSKLVKSQLGFQTGFQDALSTFDGYDDGNVVDVTAAKKEILSRAPPNKKDQVGGTNEEIMEKDVIQPKNIDGNAYDTSRTRHFVIDKSNNLVLTPGEETGSIADYESKHLADLAHQATYGVNSVAKMFKGDDLTGLSSLQKVIPDQKDFQSGVIAWSGPYNPGLPSEEEVEQQSDLSGQDLVERLEKPNDFRNGALLNEKSAENLLPPAADFGHKIHGNYASATKMDDRILKNATVHGDVVSKFQKDFRNGTMIDDGLDERWTDKEKKFFKFQGKVFDDDMKLLTEKDLEEDTNSETRTPKEDIDTFRQNALMWHNKLRCVHYADSLRLNETLSKEADEYANEIASKNNGILDHSKLESRKNEGENLAMKCFANKGTLTGAEATYKWYSDVCEKGYDFRSDVAHKGTGHFSQLIWQNTTDFGIGRAMLKKNGRYCTVIVARYYPKGNIREEFAENVKQGGYNDQTCETVENELNKKTDFVECIPKENKSKQLGKFIEEDINNALANVGKFEMKKPINVSKEKEKARLNYEIHKVTEIINRLEKENPNKNSAQSMEGELSHTSGFVESEKAKGEGVGSAEKANGDNIDEVDNGIVSTGTNKAFSDLGGTGSPVIVYHGVTGFFENPKTFTHIGVETHNKLRKIHKAPELKLDIGLTMQAFKYATYLTQLGFLQHDPKLPKDQGENLAIGCFDNNSEMSAEDAVSRWYYEVCQPGYNFKNKIAESGTGHFTQVVWKSAKKIGIAKQTRMHGNLKCTYIVARYSPAGNVHGEFKKNVEKGDFNESVCTELMRDLLKFQQRNEKLVSHLQNGLKQAQAEAKVQEKIMALMRLKAMEKQNKQKGQKQGEKPKGIKDGQKSKDKGSKAKGFYDGAKAIGDSLQGGTKLNGMSTRLENGHPVGKQYSLTNSIHKSPKQQPHVVAGILNNGLRTIVEDNRHLMHIGPTVKIVESNNGGGLMYRNIEGPSIARGTVITSRVWNQNGHSKSNLMTNGKVTEKITQQESDEFTYPVGIHESLLQNPYKTPHATKPNNRVLLPSRHLSSERWYSSPHLTSATFDPLTGRIIEKDFDSVNSFFKGVPLSNWRNRPLGSAKQRAKVQPQSKVISHHSPKTFKQKVVGTARQGFKQVKASENRMPFNGKPVRFGERYKAPKKVNVNKFHSWLPSRSPLILKRPVVAQPHHMPASLMRILHGKPTPNMFLPFALHPRVMAKQLEEHKLPNSLLRILKGKSSDAAAKLFRPKILMHSAVHERPHTLPESLLRMINAKSKAANKKPAAVKMLAPHTPEHSEHKIPASLQRMLQAKKAMEGAKSSHPTPKYWTEKPYSITLNGHDVPYSLFKMLTAEAVSGKAPKVAKYLTEKPFKIVQDHHREIPESLKKILNGRSKTARLNVGKKGDEKIAKFDKSVKRLGMNAATENVLKTNVYDSKATGLGVDATVDRDPSGLQQFQHSSYPQIESYVQQNPNQQSSTDMFGKVPPQYEQQARFYSVESPTPVMGIARTTVAGRFPETFATTVRAAKHPAAAGIKGPSLANFESLNAPGDAKPSLVKPFESPASNSVNPYAPGNSDGQLLSIDTEKDREEFERSSLEAHNMHRRMHGVKALKLNYRMSIEAEEYARKIAQKGSLDHSGTDDGENIASVCRKGKSPMTGMEASNIWYKEICDPGYDFTSEEPGGSGHFTQVVWESTTQLGVGRAEAVHDGLFCTYVVARYRPAGNFIGEFARNVLKGHFDGAQCGYTTKKSTIEKAENLRRPMVSKSVKRSRIQAPMHSKSSRKTIIDFGGADLQDENNSREMTLDNAIVHKANSVWLPDLETGLHGSDLAGMIPLRVETGRENNLKTLANETLEESSDDDQQLTADFASKLREQVNKILDAKTVQGKSKTGGDVPSKNDINAASIGFQNMEDSFKKSKPTIPPEAAGKAPLVEMYGSNSKPMVIALGSTRSGESPLAVDIATKVNEAVEKLQSAAQSVSSATSPALDSNVANLAMMGNEAANAKIAMESTNAAMATFSAKMASAAGFEGNNPSSLGSSAAQLNQNPPALGASNSPANELSTSNGPAGGLVASNMATDNQQAMSMAAENKQKASAGYKPTEFEQSGLNAHNKYRSVHDAPPLVLNQQLSKDAQAWAQQCAALGMPRRSPSTDGENVVESCKPSKQEMTASEAVDTWYSELCNPGYEFDAAEIVGAERFTEVVWKGATEMGIGRATRVKGDLLCSYIAARYHPSGNVLGDVKGNVLRGSLDSKHFCEQFLAAAKMSGKNRILDNLPVKSERMEEAGSIGSTLHAGKAQSEEEIIAGGDNPGADGASQNKKDFRLEALYTHNRFRSIHNAPPLQLDVKKCQEAEDLAANLAAKGSLMRAKDNINGQNIAMSCNKDGIEMSGDEATNKWYNEVCNPGYDFKGPHAFGSAHFMQVVWASSKKFGIGKATTTLDNMLCTWVVALYDPSGVMKGMEKENVLFGLFDYRYCDTFGKGGGGKGASSGVIHNMVDTKVAAPNAAGQSGGKRGLQLGTLPSKSLGEGTSDVMQEFIKSDKVGSVKEEARSKNEFYETMKGLAESRKGSSDVKRKHRKHRRTRHFRRKSRRFKKHTSHRRGKVHHKHHRHHHHKRHYRKKHKHRTR